MKHVYVCGSLRFMKEMMDVAKILREESICCEVSGKSDPRGITACLEKIDNADIVYVLDTEGYIGKSVCVDIGYAYAKGKQIFAMHSVEDPSLMKMITGVLSPAELVELVNKSDSVRHQNRVRGQTRDHEKKRF